MPAEDWLFTRAPEAPGPGELARRAVFVHAHPDDEASKGAATAACCVDDGHAAVLVTLTDGAAGEVLNTKAGVIAPEDMVPTREVELRNAVAEVGWHRAYQLGYPDSGWWEDLTRVPEGTFWAVPLGESGARLATILRAERPQVVVTYPEDGGYPHPDHIRCHQVSMRAVELAEDADAEGVEGQPWTVERVVAGNVSSRLKLLAMHAAHLADGGTSPYADWLLRWSRRARQGDFRVPIGGHLERRDRALLAHVTQVDPDGAWFAANRDLERAVGAWDEYELLRGTPAPSRTPATDLWAGIDA